jgi:transposase
MKYTEININKKIFGEDCIAYDWHETEKEIRIYIKTQAHSGKCSMCGEISTSYHATYKRIIQSVPIRMKTTYLQITAYKYKCLNHKCKQKVFIEELAFAPVHCVRTAELESIILSVSIFLSNEGASKVLGLMGIKVSGDTIKRLYDRVPIEDDKNIEAVGIDDVAIRRGQKYATVIYDLNDHHLIALFEGREAEPLKEWLKSHKKIKTVARDRASAYASAINKILPDCTQIADRFHLIANLINRMKDIFKAEIPNEIYVKDGNILDTEPEKVQVLRISPDSKQLNKYQYDNGNPVDNNGNPVEYDSRNRDLCGTRYGKQAENRKKKQELIPDIQKRWAEVKKKNISAIAREFSISTPTAEKYISMTEKEITALNQPVKYKRGKTIFDDYRNIIYKMLRDNVSPEFIISYIIRVGYCGNLKSLYGYIVRIANHNFNRKFRMNWAYRFDYSTDVLTIKRNDILRYITTKNIKIKCDENISKYIDTVKQKYKMIEVLTNIYNDFYETLMGKEPSKLSVFVNKYENSVAKPFIDGIKEDIVSVTSAISSDISSGFVEGNNNKFKLIKRILYGRANLDTLFKKCYLAFKCGIDKFNLSQTIKLTQAKSTK